MKLIGTVLTVVILKVNEKEKKCLTQISKLVQHLPSALTVIGLNVKFELFLVFLQSSLK